MRSFPATLSIAAIFAAVLAATPALAETPMTGPEFDAETRGLTVTFAADGQTFGTESYLENGQTVWQFVDGPCVSGVWKAQGEELCFAYASDPVPACWRFFKTEGKLRGTLSDDAGILTITETARTATPLACSPAPVQE